MLDSEGGRTDPAPESYPPSKICNGCMTFKPVWEFGRRGGSRCSWCRSAGRARERATVLGIPGPHFTGCQWRAVVERFGACLCCGQTNVLLTPDHVVPLCEGGSNEISNIQPLCGPCNSAKRDRLTDYR